MKGVLRVAILLCAVVASAVALNNGLGITPQMGYNSWYDLECSSQMNETTIRYNLSLHPRTLLLLGPLGSG